MLLQSLQARSPDHVCRNSERTASCPEIARRAWRSATRGPTGAFGDPLQGSAIGSIAVVTSTQRRVALSAATRKSQANASSKPPPKAIPCTTATVGPSAFQWRDRRRSPPQRTF